MKNRKTLKQLILGSLLLLSTNSLFAQTQKVQTLQAKNSSTSTAMNSDALIQMDSDNKGLLLPRIALTGANQVAPLTAHTAGMVVYNTATVAATATIEAVTPGYYYNDGTKWVKIANTDTADITDDAWKNNTTTNVVELATKADGTTRTAGTEMVIEDDGNVGIGTSTPSEKLYVKGRGLFEHNNSTNNRVGMLIKNKGKSLTDGTNMSNIGFIDKDNKVYGYFGDASNARLLGVVGHNSYNVQIGTSTANAAVLDSNVTTDNTTSSTLFVGAENSTHNPFLDVFNFHFVRYDASGASQGANYLLRGKYNGDVILGANANKQVILKGTTGKVGIGTTTPVHQLDVKKAISSRVLYVGTTDFSDRPGTTDNIMIREPLRTSNQGGFWGTRVGLLGAIADYKSEFKPFMYVTDENGDGITEAQKFYITKEGGAFFDGNVGIGTTTPTEKLEVAGKVKATNFIATTTGSSIPDYVFEKYYEGLSELNNNYTFKALSEVEAFIKKNGHLPGYISAKEVAKKGTLDIKQTQLTHLEKIEELYLHTIEQDKKLKAQSSKLKVQQQQIEKLEALVTKLMEAKK